MRKLQRLTLAAILALGGTLSAHADGFRSVLVTLQDGSETQINLNDKMTVLALLRVQVLRVVVMMGTFALAMAFAGNDLVNFVGVPLTGLDAYLDFMANGQGDPNAFLIVCDAHEVLGEGFGDYQKEEL